MGAKIGMAVAALWAVGCAPGGGSDCRSYCQHVYACGAGDPAQNEATCEANCAYPNTAAGVVCSAPESFFSCMLGQSCAGLRGASALGCLDVGGCSLPAQGGTSGGSSTGGSHSGSSGGSGTGESCLLCGSGSTSGAVQGGGSSSGGSGGCAVTCLQDSDCCPGNHCIFLSADQTSGYFCAACGSSGLSCSSDGDCCTGLSCSGGVCGTGPSCQANGAWCDMNQTVVCCGTASCNPTTRACCELGGSTCASASDCCSGSCAGGQCAQNPPGGACAYASDCQGAGADCPAGACCIDNGYPCSSGTDCCSGSCQSGSCACLPSGAPVGPSGNGCCSGAAVNGVCG